MNKQLIDYLKEQGLSEQQIQKFLTMLSNTTNIETVETKPSTWEKESYIKEQLRYRTSICDKNT